MDSKDNSETDFFQENFIENGISPVKYSSENNISCNSDFNDAYYNSSLIDVPRTIPLSQSVSLTSRTSSVYREWRSASPDFSSYDENSLTSNPGENGFSHESDISIESDYDGQWVESEGREFVSNHGMSEYLANNSRFDIDSENWENYLPRSLEISYHNNQEHIENDVRHGKLQNSKSMKYEREENNFFVERASSVECDLTSKCIEEKDTNCNGGVVDIEDSRTHGTTDEDNGLSKTTPIGRNL